MNNRPFKCGKCGNWYIAVPMPDDTMCRICAEGKHAVGVNGQIDCHWGQTSPTPSEIKMVVLLDSCRSVSQEAQNALGAIQSSKAMDDVKAIMSRLEQSFAKAELAQAEMPEILRWAVVMELPGMKDAHQEARFKSIEALRAMGNRRPPEDIQMLERSDKVCREIAAEIPGILSEARMNLAQVRRAAEAWTPAPADVPMPENVPSGVVKQNVSGKRPRTPAQLAYTERQKAGTRPRELVNA